MFNCIYILTNWPYLQIENVVSFKPNWMAETIKMDWQIMQQWQYYYTMF